MINSKKRIGRFTSSEIAALMTNDKSGKGFGKPALTYIQDKQRERRLGRSISNESNARPLTWGKLCEYQVMDLIGLDYKPVSKETIVHPKYDFWSGSPDVLKEEKELTVGDIKCPITLKSFCEIVDSVTIENVRENHKEGDKYYWQLVSNAVLTGAKFAELIIYAPYKVELDAIRDLIVRQDESEKFKWINWAEDVELPYLIKGNYYKNLNVIKWEIAQEEKDKLEARVLMAESMM